MAPTNTVPSADEILAVLCNDPRFSDPEAYNLAAKYVVLLPEIIGDERLGQPFALRPFLEIVSVFMKRLLEGEISDLSPFASMADVVEDAIEQLCAIVAEFPSFLADLGVTEQQAVLGADPALNPEARERYLAGTLTFADLLRLQPGMFVPQAY